jgi:cell division septation protein DedD
MAKKTASKSDSVKTVTSAPAPKAVKDVRIKNMLNQTLRISLQKPDGVLREVVIPAKGSLPSTANPAAIAEEEITTYTRGLESQGHCRIAAAL